MLQENSIISIQNLNHYFGQGALQKQILFDINLEIYPDLNYVPKRSRTQRVGVALSNSFGFGGHNVSLTFKKFEN